MSTKHHLLFCEDGSIQQRRSHRVLACGQQRQHVRGFMCIPARGCHIVRPCQGCPIQVNDVNSARHRHLMSVHHSRHQPNCLDRQLRRAPSHMATANASVCVCGRQPRHPCQQYPKLEFRLAVASVHRSPSYADPGHSSLQGEAWLRWRLHRCMQTHCADETSRPSCASPRHFQRGSLVHDGTLERAHRTRAAVLHHLDQIAFCPSMPGNACTRASP